jgi:CBASS immunity sensor of nucleotide second messenger signals
LITSPFRRDEPTPSYAKLSIPMVFVGLGLISPGFKDAAVSYLNKTFSLGLSLDAPWWIGIFLVTIGVIVFLVGFLGGLRVAPPRFIAIRHQSFKPLTAQLPNEALPKRLRKSKIVTLLCDQSNFLTSGVCDPIGAVRQQQQLANDIVANLKTDPAAILGYYGIVHIPLQFLAGCSVSTHPKVALFELERATSTWCELEGGKGLDLGVSVSRTADPVSPNACAIRIAVSYPVKSSDVDAVVPQPYRDYLISVATPTIDIVTHYDQVHILVAALRRTLDEIHNQLPSNLIVHLFYSGPVSVGFSLGRTISRTIHNRVIVYNYTANTSPAYAWGIEVTNEGLPQEMVRINI